MVRFNKRLRKFLSTPSARRATQCVIDCVQLFEFLSTPSARRATHSGCLLTLLEEVFLSTPSARRATYTDSRPMLPDSHFYPRPPRGGRPNSQHCRQSGFRFLSTPSARRATCSHRRRDGTKKFLSTPSARRATQLPTLSAEWIQISIHALREEGDVFPQET